MRGRGSEAAHTAMVIPVQPRRVAVSTKPVEPCGHEQDDGCLKARSEHDDDDAEHQREQ